MVGNIDPNVHNLVSENSLICSVKLTVKEMQSIAAAISGYFNVMAQREVVVDPEKAVALANALKKFNRAIQIERGKRKGIIHLET